MDFVKKNVQKQNTNCNKCAYKSDDKDFKGIYKKGCEAPFPIHKACRMGWDGFWKKRFNPTFRKDDTVKFVTKGFEETGKIFTVLEDSTVFSGGDEIVFCNGLSSAWGVEHFELIK